MDYTESSIFPEPPVVYANFDERLGAIAIDWLILLLPAIVLSRTYAGIGQLAIFVTNWLYFSMMETGEGQATFGKKAYKIKVTDIEGNRISFGRATARYFSKFISAAILFIGFLINISDKKKQTLHDKIAGTLVVKKVI